MLLGLLFCPDPTKVKARVFYSLLYSKDQTPRSAPASNANKRSSRCISSTNSVAVKDELSCMDDHIEYVIFKLCIISQMFIEFYALPTKKGRNEIMLLHEAIKMRNTIFFEVYLTFVQQIWEQQEKFYVGREEFISKMQEHPMKFFLKAATIRQVI